MIILLHKYYGNCVQKNSNPTSSKSLITQRTQTKASGVLETQISVYFAW